MTLREQIEALDSAAYAATDSVSRSAVLDIIDRHRCIPDRDALARAMEQTTHPWVTYEAWADAIIAALEKP